ncbi:hypothetical protein PtB15_4B739 [Puccinia triticina]|nr:hypothetical protein PtB15_4B739 [Puccinia triticina]
MAPVETPNKAALLASKVTELKVDMPPSSAGFREQGRARQLPDGPLPGRPDLLDPPSYAKQGPHPLLQPALCSQNSLLVSGSKGELVNCLMAHFQAIQTSSTPQPTPSKDLTLSSNPPGPSTSAGDAPLASTPAVPPATSVAKPLEPVTNTTNNTNNNTHPAQVAASLTEGEKEKTAEAEREKRRQRAARFGLEDLGANPPTTTTMAAAAPDELKKQLRAKRFGIPLLVALNKPLADGKQAASIARTWRGGGDDGNNHLFQPMASSLSPHPHQPIQRALVRSINMAARWIFKDWLIEMVVTITIHHYPPPPTQLPRMHIIWF